MADGGEIDAIFTSEDYGYPVAEALGCQHIQVDKARSVVPVSGTAVRNDVFANWAYINPDVR